MIQYILWDIDGTILNFEKAEKVGIVEGLKEIGIHECDDERIARYAVINRRYWEALERGEIEKSQVLVGRFREFFQTEGIACEDVEGFNHGYQLRLGDTICPNDNALELCKQLKGQYKQYIVTNGTKVAQDKKVRLSGLDKIMDGIFISEDVGYEKPREEFFRAVFDAIGDVPREQVVIIGDSLTSDMRGGTRAGIRTWWYNPNGEKNPYEDVRIDQEITDLQQVLQLLRS